MEMLISLWLPILLSSIGLFIASFIAWTLLPHHKGDFSQIPDEDAFLETLRAMNITQGQYMFPYCGTPEIRNSEEFKQKEQQGPNGLINVFPGACNMGMNMLCTYIFFLCVSFCLAYLATLGLQPGDDFMKVFRFVGTAGILAFCAGGIQGAIWFQRKIAMDLLDGIVYGLITGAIFAALWPGV